MGFLPNHNKLFLKKLKHLSFVVKNRLGKKISVKIHLKRLRLWSLLKALIESL